MEKKENIDSENISRNLNVVKPIYNITPFTLLDYPDKTACILWFAGCNMRCVYCYNPEIVFGKGKISIPEVLTFLKSRKVLLDGVVLSGGECTSHKHIKPLLQEIKKLGFLVKIDTNGSNPQTLIDLVNENLVDYVALDFKATPEKFKSITDTNLFNEFKDTLSFLIKKSIPHEVRTTIHSHLFDSLDIQQMVSFLENASYKGAYYLQNFRNNSETIGKMDDSKNNSFNLSQITSQFEIVVRNEN